MKEGGGGLSEGGREEGGGENLSGRLNLMSGTCGFVLDLSWKCSHGNNPL